MTFDISKCKKDENGYLVARTRDGRKVRILCTDAGGAYPIVGLVAPQFVGSNSQSWMICGKSRINQENSSDLVNVPAEHVVTVFLYRLGDELRCSVRLGDVQWAQVFGEHGPPMKKEIRHVITLTEGEGL